MMILFYSFIVLIILLVGFDVSYWYYCPNCQKWYWAGPGVEVYHRDDGTSVIIHNGEKHHHTTGYHGLWSKPLSK